jgi:Carboxypeptidase regulatory-like domain
MTKLNLKNWLSYWITLGSLTITTLLVTTIHAQVATANLSGTVEDSSGAVISGARVTLSDQTSDYARTTSTNVAGFFIFPAVPSSTYTLTVDANGFKSFVENNIHLDPGYNLALSHIQLAVGANSQTVTVSATQGGIPLDTGTLATTIFASQLQLLATEGRDVTELEKILPGFAINFEGPNNTAYNPATVTPQGASLNQNYISNGSGREMFDAKLDGADITTPGGYQSVTVNTDMIAETQVLTSNFGADTANGPVVMDSVTKSGTKNFHGSLYTYARTYQLSSSDWLANYLKQTKPDDRYIYPGFNVGGPVLIPGTNLGKRLTFFVGAEDDAQRNVFAYGSASSALVHALVPTAGMRTGDFSATQLMQYLGPLYGTATYVNITTVPTVNPDGSAIANGQLTEHAGDITPGTPNGVAPGLDPGGEALINLMPLPNLPATTSGGYNYVKENLVNADVWEGMARVDFVMSPRNYLFGRVVVEKSATGLPQVQYSSPSGSLGGINTPGGGLAQTPFNEAGVINLTTQIRPNLVNELFGSVAFAHSPFVAKTPSSLTAAAVGYPYAGMYQNNTKGYPQLGGTSGYDAWPVAEWPDLSLGPLFGRTWNISGGDNLTKVWGTHTIKVGPYVQREYSSENYNSFSGYGTGGGIFQYYQGAAGGTLTDVTGMKYKDSGNWLADALEGMIYEYEQQNVYLAAINYYWDVDGYAQDSWRVVPNVTLTYGVRLEHLGLWNTSNKDGIAVFDPSQINNTGLPLPGFVWHGIDPSVPTSGNSSYPLFAEPRFGLAWNIGGKGNMVLRGGYGMYRIHDSNNDVEAETVTSQGLLIGNETGSGGVTLGGISSLHLPTNTGGSLATAIAGLTKGDRQQQQVKNYSVSVDYTFPSKFLMELSYVGNNSNYVSTGNATGGVALNNVNAVPFGGFYHPDPVTGAAAQTPISIPNMTTAQVNDYRPYPSYGQVNVPTHNAWANYNGLQASLRHQSGPLLLGVNYTFSKALGIMSSNMVAGESYAALSAVNEAANYGPMPFDRSQIFNADYAYQFGNYVRGRLVGAFVNGWMLSGITSFQSGPDVQTSISSSPNFNVTGKLGPSGANQIAVSNSVFLGTPDVALMPTLLCNPKSNLAAHQYMNGACFGLPPIGQNGPNIYPYMHGPAYFDSDLSAQKAFNFSESKSLQFRLSGFNFLNHPLTSFTSSFSNQYSNLNLSNLTSYTPSSAVYQPSSGFGAAAYKQGRRVVELSAKFNF